MAEGHTWESDGGEVLESMSADMHSWREYRSQRGLQRSVQGGKDL
jgi:hypothetical protein